MEKPYKYIIVCKKTGQITETNIEPRLHELETWEETDNPNIRIKKQTKECYVDTRYAAKKRLFEYLHPDKKQPQFKPFKNTQIGISIPILNF